jgi:hypothetical protein
MTKTLTQKNIFLHFLIALTFLAFPILVFSQGGKSGLTYECFNDGNYGNCTFDDVIKATKNVVDTIIPIVLGFTVVVIAYAGFKYMISGDNAGARSEANKMLRNVAIGIFFILAAWLIVTLIARALLSPDFIAVTPVVVP